MKFRLLTFGVVHLCIPIVMFTIILPDVLIQQPTIAATPALLVYLSFELSFQAYIPHIISMGYNQQELVISHDHTLLLLGTY